MRSGNLISRLDSCPCCGGSDFHDFYVNHEPKEVNTPHEFAYGGTKYISALIKCRACKFAFSNDAREEHFKFYSMDQTTVVTKTQSGKKRYFQSVIGMTDHVLSKSDRKTSLVDIGAGNGAFIMELKSGGFNGSVDAVELNDQSRNSLLPYARSVYSTVDEIDNATTKYDVVTMFDFLEHIENPRDWLLSLHKISHKETVNIIGVPRMDSLLSRFLRQKYWLYTPMHYSYFSYASLEALLGSCFESVSIRKSPWEAGPLSSALKWLGLNLEFKKDISITVPHSSSYICVCKRPIFQPD